MTPSRILKIYYALAFAVGTALTFPIAHFVHTTEIGGRGAIIMTLCWNILFVMLLPIIMDIGERMYFNARFMQLEELAAENPELASVINEQCKTLHIAGCRFAVVDSDTEVFSYGLWRNNPRIVIPQVFLSKEQTTGLPSVERELTKFSKTEPTKVFIAFALMQVLLQQLLIHFVKM